MSRMVNRSTIFITLIASAIIFGLLSVRYGTSFFQTIWSELFWLTVSVIATSFVLENLLQRDLDNRRRRENAFAFRTFTANLLAAFLEMSGTNHSLQEALIRAALFENKKFAEVVDKVPAALATASIQGHKYKQYYLDISTGLRDLARNYVRVFASNEQEMVEIYSRLQALALLWDYKDALSSDFQAYTNTLDESDKLRKQRQAETMRELKAAKAAMIETTNYLCQLAHRAAMHSGMPLAS